LPLKVLIIDDEKDFADVLAALLGRAGYQAVAVHDAETGWERMSHEVFDLVLCDIKMPRVSGLEFLDGLGPRGLRSTVIMMSAFGTIDMAIEALKRGAYDYVSKPFKADEIVLTLRKAEEREQLRARVGELEDRLERLAALSGGDRPLLGESDAMRAVKETVARVAGYDTTVLVTGESGTGKELVARAIHRTGKRGSRSFVPVNCGAIPATLLESELFGHLRGAFTDAHQDKPGLFAEADGGTLFLDEIGELSQALQVGLLRVLQEGEVRPVGATKAKKVDVRIIAATHKNLHEAVAEGQFREDLFYRLNVLPIQVPPLRERAADVPDLAAHILARIAKRTGERPRQLGRDALEMLIGYPWPGNIRELENVLERSVVLSDSEVVGAGALPPELRTARSPIQVSIASGDLSIKKASAFIERELIKKALERTGGNRTQAARLLEISARALLYKLKDYGLTEHGFEE
jgi:two-component system response regulator AtoC